MKKVFIVAKEEKSKEKWTHLGKYYEISECGKEEDLKEEEERENNKKDKENILKARAKRNHLQRNKNQNWCQTSAYHWKQEDSRAIFKYI